LREAVSGYRSAQAVAPGRTTDWADAIQRVADDWPTFLAAAGVDAREAAARHAQTGFRERLVAVVESLTADRSSGSRPVERPPAAAVVASTG
jgi:predicted lipid-binding transport protein (Tim44 family)